MKSSVKFLILLVLGSTYACKSHNQLDQENSSIITQILPQIINTEFLFPIYPPPPRPTPLYNSAEDQQASEAKKKYDYLLSKIDLNKFVISLSDTTSIPIDSSQIRSLINSDSTLMNYFDALKSFNEEHKTRFPINFASMRRIGKFSIYKYSELVKQRQSTEPLYKFYYFGNYNFSKVYIDSKHKYGFIVLEHECGFECDSRYLFFISNKGGWKIVRHEVLEIH
jgi:hypothetical protein